MDCFANARNDDRQHFLSCAKKIALCTGQFLKDGIKFWFNFVKNAQYFITRISEKIANQIKAIAKDAILRTIRVTMSFE